jgi:uncharacterized protein (DUF924 family)
MSVSLLTAQTVLDFWFPSGLEADEATHLRQVAWWFRGGADRDIVGRFAPAVDAAARGDFDAWAASARGRLALIIVLDQFSRSVYRDTPKAWAQDPKALALALDGLDRGVDRELPNVWERVFFFLPLGHCEQLELQERSVRLAEELIGDAPSHLKKVYEYSASQARGHRDVIARFGRHPHRNAVLGRESTPEELEYLATGAFVHQRPLPDTSA